MVAAAGQVEVVEVDEVVGAVVVVDDVDVDDVDVDDVDVEDVDVEDVVGKDDVGLAVVPVLSVVPGDPPLAPPAASAWPA
jgi:hypothetical protein